jgi:hypothetical protein
MTRRPQRSDVEDAHPKIYFTNTKGFRRCLSMNGDSPSKNLMGALRYVVIGVVVAVVVVATAVVLLLPTLHRVPVQYVGSPSGYEAFVPNGQTINYNGHTDPVGDLILSNGTTIHDVVWDGKYANTIIQNQIVQLNNQFVGQTDPINN